MGRGTISILWATIVPNAKRLLMLVCLSINNSRPSVVIHTVEVANKFLWEQVKDAEWNQGGRIRVLGGIWQKGF